MIDFKTNVLLPRRLWEEARDQEQLKLLILDYVKKSYPDYVIKSVKNGFAVCERK
jgi:hypothetical protein